MLQRTWCVVALLLLVPAGAFAEARARGPIGATPIAYLSVTRAFAESRDGQAAQARLDALRQERSLAIDRRNLALKDVRRALEEAGDTINPAARRQREREMDRIETELARMLEDARTDLLAEERQLQEAFTAKLRGAVAVIATKRGIMLVLDRDVAGIVWSAGAVDVTTDVVEQINRP